MKRKKETFIYEGLGFPIELIDAPMKFVLGEWVIDVDMDALQKFVFKGLIHKPSPLSGKELRFMRKFLNLSTTEFGKKLGLSHATVVKWENEESKISPLQESYIRMFLFEQLHNTQLIHLYQEIRPEKLSQAKDEKQSPLAVDVTKLKEAV